MDETQITVIHEHVDARGLLWQEIEFDSPLGRIRGTRAVCRPESCADGHRCGKLDTGIVV